MRITTATLDGMESRYGEILELTPHARQVLARLELSASMRDEYARVGFAKVENILPSDAFTKLVMGLLPILSPVAEEVAMRHTRGADGTLSDGFRFSRVDPDHARSPAALEKLTRLLRTLGLADFASQLVSLLAPLVRYIAGPVSFRRVYFYIYREGDYISVHDDHQVGDRVDVQFPIALETVAGVRVLTDGHLRMHYDKIGSMNMLGPSTWHDVPPILRTMTGVDPVRFNMGFRFTPDE